MPQYIVTIRRTAHGFRDILVKGAANPAQASKAAEVAAGNLEFSDKTAEYATEGVIELADNETSVGTLETVTVPRNEPRR